MKLSVFLRREYSRGQSDYPRQQAVRSAAHAGWVQVLLLHGVQGILQEIPAQFAGSKIYLKKIY